MYKLICLCILVAFIQGQNSFPPTGPVGIGIQNPSYSLDIRNNITDNGTYPTIFICNLAPNANGMNAFSKSELRIQTGFVQGRILASSETGGDHLKGLYFGTLTQDKLLFNTGGYGIQATRMTIDAGGRIGIGTTLPSSKLHIKESAAEFIINGSASTSMYTTSFTMDNVGLSIGHNSASRAILFKTNSTTQMTIAGNGCVGIGVPAPIQKLEVNGTVKLNGSNPSIIVDNTLVGAAQIAVGSGLAPATTGLLIQNTRINNTTTSGILCFRAATTGSPQLVLNAAGSVGIGITSPSPVYKLDVNGKVHATGLNVNGMAIESGDVSPNAAFFRFGDNTGWKLHIGRSKESAAGAQNTGTSGAIMTIKDNGYVGIGTINPQSMLSVKGKIQAQEIKVTIAAADWPDYVLGNEYKLRSLDEVGAFIRKYKHLPGIPPAKEVAEHGVELGVMQANLLRKIEELTLYMMEQRKELVRLQHIIYEQNGRIAGLELK